MPNTLTYIEYYFFYRSPLSDYVCYTDVFYITICLRHQVMGRTSGPGDKRHVQYNSCKTTESSKSRYVCHPEVDKSHVRVGSLYSHYWLVTEIYMVAVLLVFLELDSKFVSLLSTDLSAGWELAIRKLETRQLNSISKVI